MDCNGGHGQSPAPPRQERRIDSGSAMTQSRCRGKKTAMPRKQKDRKKIFATARQANDRGVSLAAQSRLHEAAAAFDEAFALDPKYAGAASNLGVILKRLGEFDSAIDKFESAARVDPKFAEAHYNLGNAFAELGRTETALNAYRRALEVNSGYAEAWNNLARLLNDLDLYRDALDACQEGLENAGENPSLYNNAGIAHRGLGDLDAAVAAYRKAIAFAPNMARAHSNLGVALKEAGEIEAAVVAHHRAVELDPKDSGSLSNLGNSLQALGRIDEAIAAFDRSLELAPNHPATYVNLGTAEMERNRTMAAIAAFERAIAIPDIAADHPDRALAHKNLGLTLMLDGAFEAGSRHYAWRWRTREFTEHQFNVPEWKGYPFKGQTLFVHTEQGYGDAIQFLRFAAGAKRLGGQVILEAPVPLVPLFESNPAIDLVVPEGTHPPAFDLRIAMFDLMRALRISSETIPREAPYVAVDPARRERWSDRILDTGRPRIGLVWAGRPSHRNDLNRSIDFAMLRPVIGAADVDFYALQVGDRNRDIEASGLAADLIDLSRHLTNFAETAAALEHLDLLISVDTAVVHLAGALGKPAWVLLPFTPDWRWQLDRTDSPWYPSLRLFRQKARHDWTPVIETVARELAIYAIAAKEKG